MVPKGKKESQNEAETLGEENNDESKEEKKRKAQNRE
jgi:hypothetical protein